MPRGAFPPQTRWFRAEDSPSRRLASALRRATAEFQPAASAARKGRVLSSPAEGQRRYSFRRPQADQPSPTRPTAARSREESESGLLGCIGTRLGYNCRLLSEAHVLIARGK